MKAVVNNRLIIPAPGRKGVAFCLFDVNTLAYLQVPKDNNTDSMAKQILNYKGTLVFVHKKLNVYGVIKDSSTKSTPNLNWMKKEEVEAISSEILNYDEKSNIIDISEKDAEIFYGNYDKKKFNLCRTTDRTFKQISREEFISSLGNKGSNIPTIQGGQSNIEIQQKEKVKTAENTKTVEVEVVKPKIEEKQAINKEVKQEHVINKSGKSEPKHMNNKELNNSELAKALVEATTLLKETAKKFDSTTKEYKEAMARSFGDFEADVETKFVAVENIGSDLEEQSNIEDTNENELSTIYDVILKLMKIDDTMTIPRKYYEGLTSIIKRNIMLSRDGNSYDSIVLLKFFREDKKNIVARVEYEASKESTRVTIIKPYNSIELTEQKIVEYEIKFNQWKRMHSYRTSE